MGYSDYSETVSILAAQIPDAPVLLADVPTITLADRIGLTWSPPEFSGGSPIIDYTVWYDDGRGDDTFEVRQSGLQLSYTALSLVQGTTYKFKVKARNLYGFSEFSDAVSILAAQPPAVPSAPVTIWQPDDVIVQWTAPDNGGKAISEYTVYLLQNDGSTYSVELSNCNGADTVIRDAAQCTIPVAVLKASPFELPWGSNVHAKVVAWNTYGNYGESEVGNGAIITTNPDPPINLAENYA